MPTAVPSVQLPQISLIGTTIPIAVLQYVPQETAEKYQVGAFEETPTVLKLAIVHPEQLKQGFYTALKDIGAKLNKKVELFKTDSASFQALLKQYNTQPVTKQPEPELVQAHTPEVSSADHLHRHPNGEAPPKPPLFELGQTVAYNYLKRIPLDFAQQNRLISVDFMRPNKFWCVSDGSNDEALKKIIPYIEEKNDITIYLFKVSKKDFGDLLTYYEALEKVERTAREKEGQEAERVEIEREVDREMRPQAAQEEGEHKIAKGVVVPDLQGTIISNEEEKGGIAGLFQKVSHSFNAPKEQVPVSQTSSTSPSTPTPQTGTAPASIAQPGTPSAAPATPTVTSQKAGSVTAQNRALSEDDGDIGKMLDQQVSTIEQLKEHIKKGFIPRIVAAAVSFAIHEKASDIHVESFDDEVRIRYRIDGQLIDIVKLPPDIHAAMVSRIKILSRLRLDENRVPQDGRFDVNFADAQVDLRVSIMPTVHGEKVVMRILDKSKGITSLEKLGIEGLAYMNLTHAVQKPFGICLATGPTGSGKSTSLYAILQRIATPNVNVVTLEDPVEYEMKGINQSQIRPKIGYTFAEGLRSVLRQDPNIIMVGEIRDGETANMATQAALTGHLVLSTLHTNDAAGAIPRLTNMGIEPFLITSSLNVAMGQRLVRRICQNCKQQVSMPEGVKEKFQKELDGIAKISPQDARRIKSPLTFYQGTGCSECGGKGYQGRLGIYEVLVMSDAIEELTLARASNQAIQDQAQKEGMLTMYQDGLLKVVSGITTLDEVLRETSTK